MNPNTYFYFGAPAGRSGGEAVIPLPNPGEGGPVYPGPGGDAVIPLPDLGEGGPVYPGPGGDAVIPLPNPGEGGPVYPGPDGDAVIPLPNPGEGGPVYPGDGPIWVCPGCTVTPVPPIVQSGTSRVRVLNAAYGYSAFRVSVGGRRFVNRLNYAGVTGYGWVPSGYQTVTVTGMNGYIYLRKSMPFQTNGLTTIAIVNTAGGIDLTQIADRCCPPSNGWSSFRVGNLAYNSGPLDVVMSDGRVVYSDLRYKEVGVFKRIMPGTYQFFYADTNLTPMPANYDIETMDSAWLGVYPPYETFGSLSLNVNSGELYNIYLLQNGAGRNNIQNLILVDR